MKIAHESGAYHVTGEAVYIDDMQISGTLHGKVVYSPYAYAKIKSYDLSKAKAVIGVEAILTHQNIFGENQMGPIIHDELVLAIDEVGFIGQAVFLIAATTEEAAKEAEKLIEIEYEVLAPITSIEEAMQRGEMIQSARKIERGEVDEHLAKAKNKIEGTLKIGGQEQWYLETQTALIVPGEGNEITAYCSTQNPAETQAIIAEVLGVSKNEVDVVMRRMGGAFGGKETQANHVAVWAATLAKYTKQPVKIKLFRDDDQKMTGKRHRFLNKYKVAYTNEGIIEAVDFELNCDAGSAVDLTMAVLERAMMHSDNSYYIPHIRVVGNPWKTNITSNTAFRGFGGPQGVVLIEQIIDIIARKLKVDAAEIRYKNFYQENKNNFTHYQQKVENNRLQPLWDEITVSSDYKNRRAAIHKFNTENEFYKKGLALTPIKFGISFTTSFLNQAGALVNIYKDGTVLVNHGGAEMGQGLNTKMQVIAALELGLDVDKIKVNATSTAKVPNASATAASAGTDLNGAAVKNATDKLKGRISALFAEIMEREHKDKNTLVENVRFENNQIFDEKNTERKVPFSDFMNTCNFEQISLSATGFYKTPDVHFDREKGAGKPYHYFSFGMAVTEVLVDTLTGYAKIKRADILHDAGDSIISNIDIGQVEGAFIQGVGWCTTEECKWNEKGQLLNHSPDTYKIPGIQDIPEDFRVNLLQGYPNYNTIRKSKAVGEPPLMLCFSAWLAIKDAISAVGNHQYEPQFELPATNEVILLSIEDLRNKMRN